MRTKSDGIQAARSAIQSYREQAADLQAEFDAVSADRENIEHQLRETVENLATALLPSYEEEAVESAAQQSGARHLREHLKDLDKQRRDSETRVAEIDVDDRYVRRDLLIHPTTGDYSQKIREEEENLAAFQARENEFAFSEFTWLYRRGYHERAEPGVFQSLWRMVTLASQREERALHIVREKLGSGDFADLAEDYEETLAKVAEHGRELAGWEEKRQQVLELISEREELLTWVQNFPLESVRALRIQLAHHLEGCDFEMLHGMVDGSLRIFTGKCHALTKKLEYLENLREYLRKEISDRGARIASIDSVQRKWSRKPYGLLRGDKTRWLVTVPEMKREGTRKRVRWVRTVHHNVYAYDDYHDYSLFLVRGHFLPYDAFAFSADERMPYEGFTRLVIPELEEYRHDLGEERPDYGALQECLEQRLEEEERRLGDGGGNWDECQSELDAANEEESSDDGSSDAAAAAAFGAAAATVAAAALADEALDSTAEDFDDAS